MPHKKKHKKKKKVNKPAIPTKTKTMEAEKIYEKDEDVAAAPPQEGQQTADEKKMTQNAPQKKTRDWRWLLSGLTGGCIVILFLCLIALWKPEFRHANYYICDDPSILNEMLSTQLTPTDSIAITNAINEETARRKDLIEDLIDQKVIVSSDTFASNISGYYNTLIGVLSAILIILNLVGYFSWRSNANASLEQKQRELEDAINKIDDRMESNLEEILRKNQVVKERLQSFLRELLEQRETLTDDEWDKLHLLLAKYEKQETLKAIKGDNDEKNDGEIEE